jgi:hypothetical protein
VRCATAGAGSGCLTTPAAGRCRYAGHRRLWRRTGPPRRSLRRSWLRSGPPPRTWPVASRRAGGSGQRSDALGALILVLSAATSTARSAAIAATRRQPRHWQPRLAQRRPRHRPRINRIRFAIGAGRVPDMGHQLRRHPHNLLPGGQQVPLQPPRQMSAILHRPPAVSTEPVRSHHQFQMRRRRGGLGHPHPQPPPHLIHRHHRMSPLVRINPQHHHGYVALPSPR